MSIKKQQDFFIKSVIIVIFTLITFFGYQYLVLSNTFLSNKYSIAIEFSDGSKINSCSHCYILEYTSSDFSKEKSNTQKTYRYWINNNRIFFEFVTEYEKIQTLALYERKIAKETDSIVVQEKTLLSEISVIFINNQQYDFKTSSLSQKTNNISSQQDIENFNITEIELINPAFSNVDNHSQSVFKTFMILILIAGIYTLISIYAVRFYNKVKPTFTINNGMMSILLAVTVIQLLFVYFVVRDFPDRNTVMGTTALLTLLDFMFVFSASLLVSGHRIIYTAIVIVTLTVLIGQIICVTTSCSYISPVSLGNINIDNISTLYNGGNEKFVLLYFLLIALILVQYRKTKNFCISSKVRVLTAVFGIICGIVSFLLNCLPDGSKVESFQSPITGLLKVKFNSYFPHTTEKLSLVSTSILPKYVTDDFNYKETFYNDSVFEIPLTYRKLKTLQKPNLIIFFAESLTAEFIDSYRTSKINLMPYMSNLQSTYNDKKITLVRNYFNHTATTIRGIRSQLFSGFQKEATTQKKSPDSDSLVNVLKSHGYQTFFIAPESGDTFLNMLKIAGFENVLASDKNTTDFGYSVSTNCSTLTCDDDILILRFKEMVKNVKENGGDDQRPFFIAIYNMGSHMSMDGKYKFRDGTNIIFNRFFTLDRNLKDFIEFYYKELAEDTILIITADHSIIPGEPGSEALDFDKRFIINQVPMYIFQPYWDLPDELDLYETKGYMNGLALAPTVLHLMNINAPNYFLGCSIFEKCRRVLDLSHYGWYTGNGFFYEEGSYENGKKYHPEKIDNHLQEKHTEINFSLINAYREGFLNIWGE